MSNEEKISKSNLDNLKELKDEIIPLSENEEKNILGGISVGIGGNNYCWSCGGSGFPHPAMWVPCNQAYMPPGFTVYNGKCVFTGDSNSSNG